MGMGKRSAEVVEEVVDAEAKAARKAAKKAKKAAGAEVEPEPMAVEEDAEAVALAEKKAAKKAKKAAAAAAAQAEEDPEAAALAAKKAAKAAKKAAKAAAAAPAEEEEDPEAAALVAKKAAKKAKKAAAAAAAEGEEPAPAAKKEETPAKGEGKGKKGGGNDENTVFIRGLPFAATEEALNKDFGECGEIVTLRMPLNEEGASRGFCFIKYADKESMDKALKFNETDYGGRTIYCSDAANKPEKGKGGKDGKGKDGGKGKGNDENTVFVRGLPFAATEESLKKDFGECGEVLTLRMPLNEEGACKGFAFIKYADKEGMDKAMKFNETDYGGRTIYCSDAAIKPDGKGGKDGKGKDGKGKGKGKKGKGKKGDSSFNKNTGALLESTGTKVAFADSDDE